MMNFFLTNNVQKYYDDMNKEIKNLKTESIYQRY